MRLFFRTVSNVVHGIVGGDPLCHFVYHTLAQRGCVLSNFREVVLGIAHYAKLYGYRRLSVKHSTRKTGNAALGQPESQNPEVLFNQSISFHRYVSCSAYVHHMGLLLYFNHALALKNERLCYK